MDSANAASAGSQKAGSSLGQRVLSAVLLIPLVIVLVWWHELTVVAVVALVVPLALQELYSAFAQRGIQPRTLVGFGVGLALVLAATLRPYLPFDLLPAVLALAVIGSLLAELPRHDQDHLLPAWALTLAGAIYVGWLFSHIILLRSLQLPLNPGPIQALGVSSGAAWVYTVLAITWFQDTAAYFTGRAFGRHKLAPVLSPKKTWEGAAGGLVAAILGGLLCQILFGLPVSLSAAALLGLVGGVFGPLGDLAESMVKRQAGLKDAGNIIPGHGGLLDRADSLLFTAPLLYYLILLFTR